MPPRTILRRESAPRARRNSGGTMMDDNGQTGKTVEALLTVANIEVRYSDAILALRGVSLSVASGEIVVLLGPNGAGKTTTLRAVSNLLGAQRGQLTRGS